MGQINDYNIIALAEESLKEAIKPAVTDRIMTDLVNDFKARVEPIIREHVDKISIAHMESMRDIAQMRDEVKIYCEWKDKNNKQ